MLHSKSIDKIRESVELEFCWIINEGVKVHWKVVSSRGI